MAARTACISQNAAVWKASRLDWPSRCDTTCGPRQLRLVQLGQVLRLPALAVDDFIKILRRAFERGDDVTDVHLLAQAVEVVAPSSGCKEHSSRATTLRGRFQLLAW